MTFLQPIVANIPQAMQKLDHWVYWRSEPSKTGKPTKVPYRVGLNRKASSTNPATWSAFSSTVAGLANGFCHDGIGFMLSGSGFTLGDIDHCVDPVTGEIECPWVSDFIAELNTYTEFSPSGTGLRFMLSGTFQGRGKRVEFSDHSALELYCQARLGTITGVRLAGTPAEPRTDYDTQALYSRLKWGQLGPDLRPDADAANDEKVHTDSNSEPMPDSNLLERLEAWGLAIKSVDDPYQGDTEVGIRYVLEACVFNPEHEATAIFDYPSGVVYSCFHDSCKQSGYGWRDVLNKFEPVTSGNPSSGNWRELLLLGKKDQKGNAKPLATLENAYLYLRHMPEWKNVLAFDCFALKVVTKKIPPLVPWTSDILLGEEDTLDGNFVEPYDNTWSDVDDSRVTCFLQRQGLHAMNSRLAHEAVYMVARKRPFHPVQAYVRSLVWDQQPRLTTWLKDYLGCQSTGPSQETYFAGVSRAVLIQAITRIFCPGSKADYVFVLEGPQGIGKSQTCSTMFDPWFSDHLSDVNSKDARLELLGKWGIELGEFINRRTELERKSFVTSQVDNFRAPYERTVRQVPRQTVFWATTNDAQPLRDDTGGRRYWIVTCGQINLAKLRADKDMLWAEAYQAFLSGEPAWPVGKEFNEAATAEQDARYEPGPRDEAILEWCEQPSQREEYKNGNLTSIEPFDSTPNQVTIADVLTHCFEMSLAQRKDPDSKEVGRCLRRNGWTKGKLEKVKGTRRAVNFWRRPKSTSSGEQDRMPWQKGLNP
jgi:predicted P-loop ATPase